MKGLDKRDRKVLTILSLKPRSTFTDIAKLLQISKAAAKYRVERLRTLGIFEKVVPTINYEKLGFQTQEIFIKCNPIEDERKKLDLYLSKKECILMTETLFGKYDYYVEILSKNQNEIEVLRREILHILGSSLTEIKVISATERIKRDQLVEELQEKVSIEKDIECNPTKNLVNLDQLDKNILKALCEDGRATSYEIAKKLKTTRQTIRLRIKKLINETVISGFMPLYCYPKLNYLEYVIIINTRFKDKISEDEFIDYIREQGIVKLALKSIGTGEFLVYVAVQNPTVLEEFMTKPKRVFRDQIVDIDFFHLLKELRLNFFPEGLL